MKPLDPALRPHLAPARQQLAVVLGAGVVTAGLVVAQAFVIAGAVVAMVDHRSLSRWVVALVVVTGLRALTSYVGDDAAGRAAARVGATLRHRLVERLVLPTEQDAHPTGSLVVLATRGVQETEPYLTRYLPALVLAAVLPPVAVVAIATQDLLSAVIVLLTLPLVPLFAALVGWRTRDRAARQWRQLARLAGHFLDVVKGLPTLVSYRRAEHQTATIAAITNRYRLASMSTLRLAFASSAVLELVATISVALVAVSVGLRLAGGSLDLRTGLTVLLLAPEAYWPVRRVGAEFHAAAQGAAAFAEADAILSVALAGDDTAGSVTPPAGDPRSDLSGVSFGYPGTSWRVLDKVSGTLQGPGLVTVTGLSGVGKSTLLGLLQGRLAPTSGAVRVNGSALVDVDPTWWAAQVSWSPQRPFFIRGCVADNLRLGRPTASDLDLWAALRTVGLASLVSALDGGLETTVDEDGLSLSSGERTRLALARVVVADRPVVLLDEPTAHLDAESERLVAATIATLAETSLVVAVTHRPMLVRMADLVIDLPSLAPIPEPLRPGQAPAAQGPEASDPTARPNGSTASPADHTADEPSQRRTRLLVASGILLGVLASASGLALTATAGWLIVKASTQPPVLLLLVAIVAVRTFGIARPMLRYAERLVSHDAALRLLAAKRASVFAALVPLTPARLGRRRGDVLTSVVDDVEAWVDRRLRVVMPLVTLACTSALAVLVAGLLLPQAGFVDAGLLLAAGLLTFVVVRLSVRRSDTAWVDARARLADGVTELVEGGAELHSWGASGRMLARVDAESRRVETLLAVSSRRAAAGRAAVLLAVGAAVSVSFVIVAAAVSDGRVAGATGVLLVLVPLAMAELLLPVADAAVADVRTRSALQRLRRLVQQTPAVRECSDPLPLSMAACGLELVGVTAGWGARPAFRSLDLDLPAGARLGVVGPSGSGKSTVAALLVRFLDPVDGALSYGGRDLRSCSLDDVRRTVGLLDDDPHVFATTLAENVRLARPAASDADVESALRAASLGPWLDGLPLGLDTWVGQGNRAVSGGERARLGLARLILADPQVVVLDEPTAQLDSQTAEHVMRSLLAGAATRSIVLITHRPEGLDLMDRIVSLTGADSPDLRDPVDPVEPAPHSGASQRTLASTQTAASGVTITGLRSSSRTSGVVSAS